MINNELFSQITALVKEVERDTKALETKKAQLRKMTAEWSASFGAAPAEAQDRPKNKSRARTKAADLNVADAVRALVNRETGLTAPQIMDRLGLRDREAAVRSALKKDNGKHLVNVQGKWYPIPESAKNPPQKETAPAPSGGEPQSGLGYRPGEAGPFVAGHSLG